MFLTLYLRILAVEVGRCILTRCLWVVPIMVAVMMRGDIRLRSVVRLTMRVLLTLGVARIRTILG